MNKLLEVIRLIKELIPVSNYVGGDPVTIIDPGHGGVIDGLYVTAPKKMAKFETFVFYEGVFNRALAWTYAMRLFDRNLSYHILVPWDVDTPILERAHRANLIAKSRKDYNFYLHSIHSNAFSNPSVTGIEVFTSPGQTDADIIASQFFNYLKGLGWKMRPDYVDDDPDKEEKFGMLTRTDKTLPSILTETGFYTNEVQADLLRSMDTINKIADLFVLAHMHVISLKNTKTIFK